MNHSTPPSQPSPDLHLTHPTPIESHSIWTLLSTPWRDALSHSQFLEESACQLTVPLAKNGGMTQWILVHKNSLPGQRAIFASCESFKKRGLVSKIDASGDVEVEDVIIHGIASVFCDPKYRGNGYAKQLMRELSVVLETWQVKDGERCVGSILYSDIGKKYYADLGWESIPNNTHIEFPARKNTPSQEVKILLASDLEQLCSQDEAIIRKEVAKPTTDGKRRMIIIPDHDHMLWHHSKEEFVSRKLSSKIPLQKGALVGQPGIRIWAIWTHRFYNKPESIPSGNVLYILRLVIENPSQDSEELQHQLKLIFQTAQAEAKTWNLDTVKLWDPHPRVQRLVRRMGIEYSIIDREEDGIASLLCYGGKKDGRPEWLANEKYAWC